jgi:photosystem II stability/assembly factor-like uncharacterized protein
MKRYLIILCLFTITNSYGLESIYSIYKAPNKNVYAVGFGNVFMSNDTGKTWKCNHITNNQLYSVFFVNQTNGFVVGRNGLLFKTIDKGNTWSIIPLMYTNKLYSIYFPSIDTGFITGEDGLILKTFDGGETWLKKETNFHGRIFSISNNKKNTWVAVGDSGKVLKSSDKGETWNGNNFGNNRLRSVQYTKSSIWYIVGDNTTMLKTINDGQAWNTMTTSYSSTYFNAINFLDNSNAVVVGYNGMILQTNDAGNNWSSFQGNTSTWLNTVLYYDSNTLMTAGDDGTFYVYDINKVSKIEGQTSSWINGNVSVLSNSLEDYSYSLRDTNSVSSIIVSGGILLNDYNNQTFSVQWGSAGIGKISLTESNLLQSNTTILNVNIHDILDIQSELPVNHNAIYQSGDILYIHEFVEKIEIIDINGRILKSFDYNDRISLSFLNSGIYFAKIKQKNSYRIFKIIMN